MPAGQVSILLEEKSAGAVVFHASDSSFEYLLLKYEAGHWDFPKGAIEEGETELDTARREVREETALDGLKVIEGFRREIGYKYRKHGRLVSKRVAFYLIQSDSRSVRISREHRDFLWLKYEHAVKKLTYKTAKETLTEAHKFNMARTARQGQA